jgi:hypothetical protein
MPAHPSAMPLAPRPGTPAPAAAPGDPLRAARYLDVALLVLAAPFVIAFGAPVLGFVVGVAAWTLQRVLAAGVERHVRRMPDFRRGVALQLASSLARAWGVAIAILLVGVLGEREHGLTAGITVLAAFTVYFALSLILRPLERKSSRA